MSDELLAAQDAKPDHIPGAGKMVSDRERRLVEALTRCAARLLSIHGLRHDPEAVQDRAWKAALADVESARAALAEAQGGGEE